VAVNCAAIPNNLIEAELFGHEKGAFTDARAQRAGLFEEAQGGTIFLDEITSTTLDFQVKLLRVLQEEKIRRVGANKEIDLDVRVIAASNKNLEDEIRAGSFREDLYFRLKGMEIFLPRLAEREKDIIALARHFADRAARREKKQVYFSEGVIQALNQYSWPGNVRELESVIEYAIPRCNGTVLLSDLPDFLREAIGQKHTPSRIFSIKKVEELRPLAEIVDLYAVHSLDVCDGNKSLAAEKLGCDRKFFYKAQERIASGETDPLSYFRVGVGRGQKKNGNTQEELPLQ
jgi:two-component system response regulator HydG